MQFATDNETSSNQPVSYLSEKKVSKIDFSYKCKTVKVIPHSPELYWASLLRTIFASLA